LIIRPPTGNAWCPHLDARPVVTHRRNIRASQRSVDKKLLRRRNFLGLIEEMVPAHKIAGRDSRLIARSIDFRFVFNQFTYFTSVPYTWQGENKLVVELRPSAPTAEYSTGFMRRSIQKRGCQLP
jgi:hypothetical protein